MLLDKRKADISARFPKMYLVGRLLAGFECLVKIVKDILNIFNANRYTNIVLADTGSDLLFIRKLLMSGTGRMNNQRLGVTNVRKVAAQFHRINELCSCLSTALDSETEDCALTSRQLALGPVIISVTFEAWIIDLFNGFMCLKELGYFESVFAMSWHAHMQCLKPLQELKSIEG
jgi:hypothetical protein